MSAAQGKHQKEEAEPDQKRPEDLVLAQRCQGEGAVHLAFFFTVVLLIMQMFIHMIHVYSHHKITKKVQYHLFQTSTHFQYILFIHTI